MYSEFCKIAGISFRQPSVKKAKEGDKVQMIAEPLNQYDSHAVKVIHEMTHEQLGYVPRTLSERATRWLQDNRVQSVKIASIGKPNGSPHVGAVLEITLEGEPDGPLFQEVLE